MIAPHRSDAPWLLTARGWLVWGAAVLCWGLLFFWYRYLEVLADRDQEPFLGPLINEMSGALAFGVLFFIIRWLVRRFPLRRETWRRHWPYYPATLGVLAISATTIMWALRSLLYPVAGLGSYDYGVMPLRYLMELPMQAIGFGMCVFALHAFEAFRDAKERQIRAAEAERALAQAQVRTLRLQLQPHFLFNALNTVSATMYRDPAAADELIDQLSGLLRASLQTTQRDEVPLADELELLHRYLALMRARFGDSLQVAIHVDNDVTAALVPSMVLQPLVENAIRHGNATINGRGAVEVRAVRTDTHVVIRVEDDGPGVKQDGPAGTGVGLSATAERLALLYGSNQSLEVGNRSGGGFAVTITMPFRTASERRESSVARVSGGGGTGQAAHISRHSSGEWPEV